MAPAPVVTTNENVVLFRIPVTENAVKVIVDVTFNENCIIDDNAEGEVSGAKVRAPTTRVDVPELAEVGLFKHPANDKALTSAEEKAIPVALGQEIAVPVPAIDIDEAVPITEILPFVPPPLNIVCVDGVNEKLPDDAA